MATPTPPPESEAAIAGSWNHKTARVNVLGTIVVAVLTAGSAIVGGYLAGAANAGNASVAPVTMPPSQPPSVPPPVITFAPVDNPVDYCNVFRGTGSWDPKTSDLMLFDRSWDNDKKTGTSNYYLDGDATQLAGGDTWKGPLQKIGRDAPAGFMVEIAAVVVSRPWAEYLRSVATDTEEQGWSAQDLPPHDAVATLVVTRTGTTQHGCTAPAS